MKLITTIVFGLIFFIGNTTAQYTYKWDTKFFSFTSPFELTRMNPNATDEFNLQNDEYTIEVSSFGLGYYNTYYGNQRISEVAKAVAIDQSFYDITDGDSLPLIESGYYVLAKTPGMEDSQYAYVIVVIGFSEKRKIYFEARIYCYNNKYKKGIEIAKSFSFAK
jgi:hypothetical protein